MKRILTLLGFLIFTTTAETTNQSEQAPIRRSDRRKITKFFGEEWIVEGSNKHSSAQPAVTNTHIKTKYASTFFEHWIKYQNIYEEKPLHGRNAYGRFGMDELNHIIQKIDPLHQEFVNNILGEDFLSGKNTYPDTDMLNELLYNLSNRKTELKETFKTLSFMNEQINVQDAFENRKDKFDKTVSRYAKLAKLLFFCSENVPCEQFNFNLANSCFEYLFYWHKGKANPLFEQKANYQIVRFMYSIIYKHLIEIGWIHWSKQTLRELKAATEDGTPVTYIAGGCDIYQLLKSGIYNSVVIDPFPPFEEKYYIDNFLWFVEGNIGDVLIFDDADEHKQIVARRDYHTNHHSNIIITTPKGKKLSIPKTTTIWNLYDYNENKIGSITFERRLCTQNDFKNQIVLMSLNEALLAFSPKSMDGWSMNTHTLADNFHMYIKQLHDPIGKHELQNYVRTLDPKASFDFIDLCTLGV